MAKTPDNFLRPPSNLKPIADEDLFIRLEYASLRYYIDDLCLRLHRTEGPAVIHDNGSIEYWNQGQLHRVDGPAIQTTQGKKVYYLFGRRLPYEKWVRAKQNYDLDYSLKTGVIKVHENNGETRSAD